jgi:hypothetical protein
VRVDGTGADDTGVQGALRALSERLLLGAHVHRRSVSLSIRRRRRRDDWHSELEPDRRAR